MIRLIKKIVKSILRNDTLRKEYLSDYRLYKKWNYNNPSVNTQNAYEAKILRQTHVIEKGLSLSKPRKGFGVKRINELFVILDEYLSLGFSPKDIPFQNAVHVLEAYKAFQINVGYNNEELFSQIDQYLKYMENDFSSGIVFSSYDELSKGINGSFPEFFCSRHSMRQFSDKKVDINDIEKAVRLAQRAPSACNRQATKVYYYSDDDVNQELGNLIAGNTGFDDQVQTYLVITGDISSFYDSFERNQLYVEGGMFSLALIEALHYYGIASCVLQNGEFQDRNKQFKNICKNIPENEKIILFIAIGYYNEKFSYAVSKRKNTDKVLIIK